MKNPFIATAVWSAYGALVLIVIGKVVDWIIPTDIWGEIKNGNQAIATFSGAFLIALAVIIASILLH